MSKTRSTKSHETTLARFRACSCDLVQLTRLHLCLLATAVILASAAFKGNSTPWSFLPPVGESNSSFENDLDARLQAAAVKALAGRPGREGTVVVMDPQTGRVRAVVNPQLAFAEAFAPGSTIKPFTTIAAMETGLIDDQSRVLCRGTFTHQDFHTACSHPRDLPSFNATEAIAYSCNNFFGTLGERLSESAFDATLTEFGFGQATGIGDEHESAGNLSSGQWQPKSAIGEGDHLLVTPIQLITAYSALVNGGHLFKPSVAPHEEQVRHERRQLAVDARQRSIIIEGMRGAVRYGTAEEAKLSSLPLYVFGKTGTSTEIKGFRTQGWFVGFASELAEGATSESLAAPENVKLAVLVLLKRAHGADASEIARPIFETFAVDGPPVSSSPRLPVLVSLPPPVPASAHVRVHLVTENSTLAISIEDYVAGVVATEGSLEQEPEALKALAVASRTYALRNLGRHGAAGYDFCSTTHCQRYRPTNDPAVSALVRDAVQQTSGESLRDAEGRVAEAYFSASCGGATANINTLWGANAPPHLRGVEDDFCMTMPHATWTDVISNVDLLRALQGDPRTNVGKRLTNISVARRDATGRAQSILIEGDQRRIVAGWDFKIIVGRALGWNLIKSSRFDASRSASNFVFRGSGFGHGLGLCQEGAHVMARRGANYRQILAKYFPGTSLAIETSHQPSADLLWGGDSSAQPIPRAAMATDVRHQAAQPKRTSTGYSPRATGSPRKLSSENFRITYPALVSEREADNLVKLLESSRADLIRRLVTRGVKAQLPTLEVFINDSTGNFVGRTGQPPWAAAATRGNLIELQPLALLKRRGVLETTVRHELVHVVIKALARGYTPRWLEEGLALYMAGEGPMLSKYVAGSRMSSAEIEQMLEGAQTNEEMGAAYAAAYGEVSRLIKTQGEAAVWRRVLGRSALAR
jgi:stage II sporulation protein D (peptidoglycan lytic transglycosylase)